MWRALRPDGFASLFPPEAMFRRPSTSEPLRASEAVAYMREVQATLPDVSPQVHRWAASGDSVLVEFTISATTSGRAVRDGADRFTLCDDRAVDALAYFDAAVLQHALVAES